MPKFLLLLLLALATGYTTLAQGALAPVRPARPLLTRDDTARAVSHLFERRRQGGKNWLYFSISGVLVVVRVLATPTTTTVNGYQTKSEVDGGAAAAFGAAFFGLPVVIGVGKLVHFSEKKEIQLTAAYASGSPLPRRISRRLRPKDFVRTIF